MRSSTIGSSSCRRTWGIEPQEFNIDALQMSKCQERAMGSWKGVCAYRGDIRLEEDSNGNIEILLFFFRSKRGEFREAIVGMADPERCIRPGAISEDIQ